MMMIAEIGLINVTAEQASVELSVAIKENYLNKYSFNWHW